ITFATAWVDNGAPAGLVNRASDDGVGGRVAAYKAIRAKLIGSTKNARRSRRPLPRVRTGRSGGRGAAGGGGAGSPARMAVANIVSMMARLRMDRKSSRCSRRRTASRRMAETSSSDRKLGSTREAASSILRPDIGLYGITRRRTQYAKKHLTEASLR